MRFVAVCAKYFIAASFIAALTFSWSVAPAAAQGHRGKRQMPDSQSVERRAKNAQVEKDYKAALDKIPDQKPSDPWGNVRSAEPVKAGTASRAVTH